MAPRVKQIFSWAGVAVLLTILTATVRIAWGASGRFTSIEGINTTQTDDIQSVEMAQDQADDEIMALIIRIEVLEQWKIITDTRLDNEIGEIKDDVRDIRNYLMGDRQ